MSGSTALEIVVAAAEATPYCKTGGLAEVVGSLAKALVAEGCRIHLFLPLYRTVRESCGNLAGPLGTVDMDVAGRWVRAGIFSHSPFQGLTTYFIGEDSLFDREGLYGDAAGDYVDNDLRFTVYCRALLAAAEHLGLRPHLVHCHDWQSALVPLYLRHRPELSSWSGRVPTVLTIHNLAYQGIFPRDALRVTGIPDWLFQIEGVEFYGRLNLLKGGILTADALSTVSPRYSREIQTPEMGAGLDGVLQKRSGDLHGILNGVDYEVWDPATDPFLPANYSPEDRSGKALCKRHLLDAVGLDPDPGAPLLAMIARLVEQKGFDIAVPALPGLLDIGYRFVLLGSGSGRYEKIFSGLARRYPGRLAVRFAYDEGLSHRIEAGADFYLMPSRFEPCGLNQIYSLRYGTIPIVRAVGGLDDTVAPYQPLTGLGNGLKFSEYSPEALMLRAHEAFLIYRRPEHMGRLVANAMAADFSWARSARLYMDLFRRLAGSRTNDPGG